MTRRFDVMSIPTLILFKDGEPVSRLIGAKPKGQLLEEIAAVSVALPLAVGDRGAAVARHSATPVRRRARGRAD